MHHFSRAVEQKLSLADAAKAGLLASRESGPGFYDRFRSRLSKVEDADELARLRDLFVAGAALTCGAFPDEAYFRALNPAFADVVARAGEVASASMLSGTAAPPDWRRLCWWGS